MRQPTARLHLARTLYKVAILILVDSDQNGVYQPWIICFQGIEPL